MKLISRKAAIAALTAAAVTAGTLTAPAMAQSSETTANNTASTKESAQSTADNSLSSKVSGSSDSLFEKDPETKKSKVDGLKEWLTLLTTIGSLLGALYTIGNNIDRLNRAGR